MSYYMTEYEKWLNSDVVDQTTKNELLSLKGNEKELEYRFSKNLEFGTGGLRGLLGAGTNMMNIYTVRYATQGLSTLIQKEGKEALTRGVAIAFDSRHFSSEFAKEVACVLAANGVHSYLFDELRPTPELSFAVRELNCVAGVNITASHNPKEYNGYKAYWEDGAQIAPEQADIVIDTILNSDIFDDVRTISFDDAVKGGFVKILGKDFDDKYLAKVLEQTVNPDIIKKESADFKIIYTPFHGAGYRLVPKALEAIGVKNLITVPEQMVIDGSFPTVKSPNPEEREGFNLATELAKKNGVDLILGTDPDADRVGVVIRNSEGEYIALSGNQIGALILNYIITAREKNGTMPENPCVIKTIVTSEIAAEICRRHNVSITDVFTGFKFIGEKILLWEKTKEHTFLFGYEESFGYLAGTYCRDKDAVFASVILTEAAAYYKSVGKTLFDALNDIYKEYGYYVEKTVSIVMPGLDGLEKMKDLMSALRKNHFSEIAGIEAVSFRDYSLKEITNLKTGEKTSTGMGSSNVLFYKLSDDTSVVVRPSGTEPKIKIYYMTSGESPENAQNKLLSLVTDMEAKLKSLSNTK